MYVGNQASGPQAVIRWLLLALLGLLSLSASAQTAVTGAAISRTMTVGTPYTESFVAAGSSLTAVGTLPPGLSFAGTTGGPIVTGTLSGTPSVGGTYSFVLRVTIPLGAGSAIVDTPFVATVAGPAGAAPVSVTVPVNSSNNPISASVSGTVTSVAVVSSPAHGTVSVSGLGFSYTPAANYVGSDSFSYTATGPLGTSAPALVSISVVAPPPSAADATLAVPYGTPGTIDLAPFVSGPTFTGIGITVISSPSHGTATVSGTRVTYTPAAGYSGGDSLTYVATAIGGTSRAAVLTITVGSRPDPRSNPSVTSTLKAGAAMVRRFQTAQTHNIQSRLDGIDADVPGPGQSTGDCGGYTLWSAGVSGFGSVGGSQGAKFDTSGLSVGGDRCFGESARVGLAVGYGRDRGSSRLDSSRNNGSASSATAYGSLKLLPQVRIAWMAGVGRVEFNYDRQVAELGDFAHGRWAGTQWQSSVSANYDWRYGDFRLAPFSRVDTSTVQLDGYAESGAGAFALRYDGQRLETGRVTLGVNSEYRYEAEFGKAVPRLRIEYTKDFAKRRQLQVGYADSPGAPGYSLPADEEERRITLINLGVDFYLRNGLSWGFNLGHSRANGGNGASAAQARVSQKF
jgi:uncharacterized protein YhjY with autotransporter beta-barrel domain